MANFVKSYVSQQDGYISLKPEIENALRYFDDIDVNKKKIGRAVFNAVGRGGVRAAKKNYGSVLKKRSGKLYKSIKSRYYDDHTFQWIEVQAAAESPNHTGKHGGPARYGFMLGAGYKIIATKAHPSIHGKKTILHFQVDGKWVSTHSVKVEQKDIVEGPVTRYTASRQCQIDMDKEVSKQMDKITKKFEGKK